MDRAWVYQLERTQGYVEDPVGICFSFIYTKIVLLGSNDSRARFGKGPRAYIMAKGQLEHGLHAAVTTHRIV